MLICPLRYTHNKMRVLEPKQLNAKKNKSNRRGVSKIIVFMILISLASAAGLYLYSLNMIKPTETDISFPEYNLPENDPFDVSKRPLKKLSGDQFKDLYLSVAYPNTQEIVDPPEITGDKAADDRIRIRAEARGYKLSRIPMGAIIKVKNEPRLDDDDLLQPLAADAWYKLKDAARRDGFPISLLSAYRTPKYQQDLFVQRLLDKDVTISQIGRGMADNAIDATLELTAVPGYSRHHTGYTIDLWCEDGSTSFLTSKCYKWISNNQYEKAMEYGWIPSYPDGATEQGPEPEPWEYVWVGNATRQ